MKKKRHLREVDEFVAEAKELATSSSLDRVAEHFLRNVLPELVPPSSLPPWMERAILPAKFALACSLLEGRRGWTRAGEIDGRVAWVLFQARQAAIQDANPNDAQVIAFLFDGAYYTSRTGDMGMSRLKAVRLREV